MYVAGFEVLGNGGTLKSNPGYGADHFYVRCHETPHRRMWSFNSTVRLSL